MPIKSDSDIEKMSPQEYISYLEAMVLDLTEKNNKLTKDNATLRTKVASQQALLVENGIL